MYQTDRKFVHFYEAPTQISLSFTNDSFQDSTILKLFTLKIIDFQCSEFFLFQFQSFKILALRVLQ